MNILNKIKHNRKGFTHFETALVIIVVAVVAAAGLYILNYNKNQSKASTSGFLDNSAEIYSKQIDNNTRAEIRACKYTYSNTVSISYFGVLKYSQKPATPPVKIYFYNSADADQVDFHTNYFSDVVDTSDGIDLSWDYDTDIKDPKMDVTTGIADSPDVKYTFILSDASNNKKIDTVTPNIGAVPDCFTENYDFYPADSTTTTTTPVTPKPSTTTTTPSTTTTTTPTTSSTTTTPKPSTTTTTPTSTTTTTTPKPSTTTTTPTSTTTTTTTPKPSTTTTTPSTTTSPKTNTPATSSKTTTTKNVKPKIKVISKKAHDKKVQVAVKKAKFYPHNYESFTRVAHACCFAKGKVMNYDAWWTDQTKQELIVQMRVYIPENSNYVPSNFRSAVWDGNRRVAYFRISDGVPVNWYASPKATYAQVNNSKAPTGRYYGEAHIKAKDIKGDFLKFQTYYIAGAKSEPGISKDIWSKTIKINKAKLAVDNPKSKIRGIILKPIANTPNTILSFENDKATFLYTGCVNKTDKTKLDISVSANVPANFNHILRGYQANLSVPGGKSIVVLGLDKTKLPAGAKADALDHIKPQAGVYSGTTTITKVPDLKLGLFYNVKSVSQNTKNTTEQAILKNTGGLLASTMSNTNMWPVCK